jgi:hypothetical protein
MTDCSYFYYCKLLLRHTAAVALERLAEQRTRPTLGNRPAPQQSGPPQPARRRDHDEHDGRGGQAPARPEQRPPSDRGAHERHDQQRRPFDRQAATPTAAPCSRCGKPGHSIEACISRHDAQGNKLDKVDAEVYAKRKDAAIKLIETRQAARPKVMVVAEASGSDTEDVEAFVHDDAYFDADDDCDTHGDNGVHGIFECAHPPELFGIMSISTVDDVPAPSLLKCGDVECNPGPFDTCNLLRFLEPFFGSKIFRIF